MEDQASLEASVHPSASQGLWNFGVVSAVPDASLTVGLAFRWYSLGLSMAVEVQQEMSA